MEKFGNQLHIISYERTIASQNHQFEYSYILFDGKESSHLKFILYGAQPVRRKALPSSHKFPLLELLGGCAFSSLTTSTDAALATGSRLL